VTGARRLPRTGDWYRWHAIAIEVGDVDPDGGWVMIHCTIPCDPEADPYGRARVHHEWDKQQPTPDGGFPADWVPVPPPPGRPS
jgi:hypothetical protein